MHSFYRFAIALIVYFVYTEYIPRVKEQRSMWAYESVFYQIYPIGFCGAPRVNDGITVPRIRKAADWVIEHSTIEEK